MAGGSLSEKRASLRITFVRHGQSEANAAKVWQGRGSTPLTADGRDQAAILGRRIGERKYDLVLSSDIERAFHTAQIAGHNPQERLAVWREGDIGAWDGLSEKEILERYADDIARLRKGEDLPFGETGESMADVRARVSSGIDDLIDRLGPDDHALVVTHGGVIAAAVRQVLNLPTKGRGPIGLMMNTAITEIDVSQDRSMKLVRYADAGHLGGFVGFASRMHGEGAVVVDLIRHGLTDANEAGWVQGQTDWGLNDQGRSQAEALGGWIGQVDAVFASPLGRAAETAAIAFADHHEPEHHDGLKEIHMGEWEGQNWADIVAGNPELGELWHIGDDFHRGGTGESYAQLRDRANETIRAMAGSADGPRRVAAVSHAGTIGAYIRTLLGLSSDGHNRLARLTNTSVSRVVFTEDGPLLADYNVSYHLETNSRA